MDRQMISLTDDDDEGVLHGEEGDGVDDNKFGP